jgi:DsbC/DsbD-like thiol-disulfide interchange protein
MKNFPTKKSLVRSALQFFNAIRCRAMGLLVFAGMALITAEFSYSAEIQTTPPKTPFPKMPGTSEPGQIKTGDQLAKLRTLTDVATIKPGEKFHVALVFDIEPGWHIYWKNSGDSGAATNVKVQAPQGFTIGHTQFPRPLQIKTADGVSYGYENQVALFLEAKASDTVKPGMANFNVNANWLVCKEVCLIGRASQAVQITVTPKSMPIPVAPESPTAPDPAIEQFKAQLPQSLDPVEGAEVNYDGKVLTAKVPAQDFSTAEFFPANTPGVTYGKATVKMMKSEGMLLITIPITVEPQNSLGEPLRIAGLIGLGKELSDPCYEFELPLADAQRSGGG